MAIYKHLKVESYENIVVLLNERYEEMITSHRDGHAPTLQQ